MVPEKKFQCVFYLDTEDTRVPDSGSLSGLALSLPH